MRNVLESGNQISFKSDIVTSCCRRATGNYQQVDYTYLGLNEIAN